MRIAKPKPPPPPIDDASDFSDFIETLICFGGVVVLSPDIVPIQGSAAVQLRRARISIAPVRLAKLGINATSSTSSRPSHYDVLWFRLPESVAATMRSIGSNGKYIDSHNSAGSVVLSFVKLRSEYGFASLRIDEVGSSHWVISAQSCVPVYQLAPVEVHTSTGPVEGQGE